MEEVLQRYLGDELAERKKIHEEEMKELSKLVLHKPFSSVRFKKSVCHLKTADWWKKILNILDEICF